MIEVEADLFITKFGRLFNKTFNSGNLHLRSISQCVCHWIIFGTEAGTYLPVLHFNAILTRKYWTRLRRLPVENALAYRPYAWITRLKYIIFWPLAAVFPSASWAYTINHFTVAINQQYSTGPASVSHFHPSLIFVSKVGAYPSRDPYGALPEG